MTITLDSLDGVMAAVGTQLGHTEWMRMEQDRIQRFADATDDQQWIHVDPLRAADGPFGACIAHGYLTLSLASRFLPELARFERLKMGINYGCEAVRFPAPVKVGSRLRGRGELLSAELIKGDGVQVTIRITVEIEGQEKPACVVNTISRLYFE